MIGYHITQQELEKLIEAEKKGWLARATKLTKKFRDEGKYSEPPSPIWSEIKSVYMTLQGECKCAFCERKFESITYGKIELDVEHFRPKSNVKEWPLPKSLAAQGVKTTTVPAESGYFLLPYNLFNYSVACKTCNTIFKKDYFPIAGAYDFAGDDPKTLQKEKPLLICPIGDFDTNPEELIRFHGVSPQAVATNGHDRARALVTIEFFQLDDETGRKNLLLERANIIVALYMLLKTAADSSDPKEKARMLRLIKSKTSDKLAHTNCARSFVRLFESSREEAEDIFKLVGDFVDSCS